MAGNYDELMARKAELEAEAARVAAEQAVLANANGADVAAAATAGASVDLSEFDQAAILGDNSFLDLRNSRGTNGYNTSTGLYTAPVAGVYNCCWVYLIQTIDNAARIDDGFVINGSSYYYGGNRYTVSGYGWGDGYVAVKGSVNVYLNQNDTFAPRTSVIDDTSWSFYGGYNWGWITIALIG